MATPTTIPIGVSGRPAIDVARDAALEAGALALSRFRQPHEITVKGRGDLLTETDLAVETLLHRAIKAEFPKHELLSEETASKTPLDGWVWVIDPIDGTRNFVSGIPFFCVNIALSYNGDPVVAVTHDPNHEETFWATQGGGAWVNDSPIRASVAPTVAASVLGVDLGYDDDRGRALIHLLHELFPGVQSVRIPGSAALGMAYAAAGRYDLFVHHYLFPWDIAAGILLVREAGGRITDHTGRPVGIRRWTVLCGSESAHTEFLAWQEERSATLDLPAPSNE
jgi:fructose-1,6-bisphosphatase/inositol monophosphatase family enzyme